MFSTLTGREIYLIIVTLTTVFLFLICTAFYIKQIKRLQDGIKELTNFTETFTTPDVFEVIQYLKRNYPLIEVMSFAYDKEKEHYAVGVKFKSVRFV